MEVLTDTRNRIVHPQEDEALSMEGIVEVWKLALWYIELILLRLCGHNGEYVNRLTAQWVGVVERVPWATEDE